MRKQKGGLFFLFYFIFNTRQFLKEQFANRSVFKTPQSAGDSECHALKQLKATGAVLNNLSKCELSGSNKQVSKMFLTGAIFHGTHIPLKLFCYVGFLFCFLKTVHMILNV